MLARISAVADEGTLFACPSGGGNVIKLDEEIRTLFKVMIRRSSATPYRKGGTYVMDVYVKVPLGSRFEAQVSRIKSADAVNPSFHRQGSR